MFNIQATETFFATNDDTRENATVKGHIYGTEL